MLLEEYDYETDIRVQREESFEAGEIKGRKEGKSEAKLEGAVIAVRKFHAEPKTAAAEYNVPIEELLAALEKN